MLKRRENMVSFSKNINSCLLSLLIAARARSDRVLGGREERLEGQLSGPQLLNSKDFHSAEVHKPCGSLSCSLPVSNSGERLQHDTRFTRYGSFTDLEAVMNAGAGASEVRYDDQPPCLVLITRDCHGHVFRSCTQA